MAFAVDKCWLGCFRSVVALRVGGRRPPAGGRSSSEIGTGGFRFGGRSETAILPDTDLGIPHPGRRGCLCSASSTAQKLAHAHFNYTCHPNRFQTSVRRRRSRSCMRDSSFLFLISFILVIKYL